MIEVLAQVFIALFGVTAIWLSQDKRPHVSRYACIFGLLAAPFWFLSAILADQWGIFCLNFLYLAAWARGFNNHFIQKVIIK